MSLRKKPTTPPNPEAFELGFGTKFIGGKSKIIKADGQFNILRKGVEKETFYEHMIRLPWPLFIIELLAIFIIVNAFYATIFCFMGPNAMYGVDYKRRFQRLNLDLSHLYLLPLNWTVVHLINEESPLYEKSADLLAKNMMEFIVMIKAFDPQYNQHIFKNYSYDYSSIKEGAKFKLMYHSTDEMTILDIHELDSYTDLQMELP